MNETDQQKQKHFGLILLISFGIFNLGFIINETIRWSNHFQGFVNGMFHVILFGIGWCIYLLPWSLIIYVLYKWRKWRRFRAHWILAPAILAFLVSIGALIASPPSPSKRFKNFAKTELPQNIHNLHYYFSGGGIADYSDIYYFETSPEEVDRIIADMKLTEDEFYGSEELTHTPVSSLPNCPDLLTWEGAKQYSGWDENQHWYYYLIADSSRTKVYMLVGCI